MTHGTAWHEVISASRRSAKQRRSRKHVWCPHCLTYHQGQACPSKAEIRLACWRIQSTWSARTEIQRRGLTPATGADSIRRDEAVELIYQLDLPHLIAHTAPPDKSEHITE